MQVYSHRQKQQLSFSTWNPATVLCLQAVRQAVLDLAVELIVVSSAFVPNCLQVRP